MDIKALGKRLKELRGARSREQVARSIQANQGFIMSQQTIYLLESAKLQGPNLRHIDALAREYGVTVEFLSYGVKATGRKTAV